MNCKMLGLSSRKLPVKTWTIIIGMLDNRDLSVCNVYTYSLHSLIGTTTTGDEVVFTSKYHHRVLQY